MEQRKLKIVVLDGYALNPGDLDWSPISQFGELTVYDRSSADQVLDRVQGADLVLTNKAKLTESHIQQLPTLRYIGELATGYDNVDIKAAASRGIPVCNVPGYSTSSVAQLTWALILATYNRVEQRSAEVFDGAWSRSPDFTHNHQGLADLQGKTLVLVGFGAIATAVAKIALAFGMKVIAVVRHPDNYRLEGVSITDDLHHSFAQADVLSLHCPLNNSNHQMINKTVLNLMKPNTLLVNTARGALIGEQDLADALNQGRIAGAALDVLSQEPPAANHPLLKAKNCLITPHVGWASKEARTRLMEIAAANIKGYLQGKLQNVVNKF